MLPRLARHLKLHFPPQSTKFCNQAIGCTLVELDTGTFIPLSALRTRLDTDVLATVQRELSAIPEAFQVSFTAQAREDGSRFLFAVDFASADIHATGLQARLLRHPLVQSRFPPTCEGEDLGILAHGISEGIQSGDQVFPIEENTGSEVCLGTELDLEYGTLGPFVWQFDPTNRGT
jgi:hypothetical protein